MKGWRTNGGTFGFRREGAAEAGEGEGSEIVATGLRRFSGAGSRRGRWAAALIVALSLCVLVRIRERKTINV